MMILNICLNQEGRLNMYKPPFITILVLSLFQIYIAYNLESALWLASAIFFGVLAIEKLGDDQCLLLNI